MKKFQDPDGKIYTEDEIKEKFKWTHDYLMEHRFFTEVKENDMREEVIFDATCEVYGVYGDILTERAIDSRSIFHEVREFADYWMEHYEPLLGTVIPEDAYLDYVTLASLSWFKAYLGFSMTNDDELMICNNQRIAQACRQHDLTPYDYDCWLHLETILEDELTYEEFHKLGEMQDDICSLAVCEGNKKSLAKDLDDIRNPKVRIPVYVLVKQMRKTWVEVPNGSGEVEILQQAKDNVLDGDSDIADDWDIEIDDILDFSVSYDGTQEG